MHRTQIMLEDWQYELLVREAETGQTSLAHLVRTAVSQFLENQRPPRSNRSLNAIAGIGADPSGSGAEHDRLLYESPARDEPSPGEPSDA